MPHVAKVNGDGGDHPDHQRPYRGGEHQIVRGVCFGVGRERIDENAREADTGGKWYCPKPCMCTLILDMRPNGL